MHITGWIASSIVTSSLLKAAGLGAGAAGAVAAGAAIKWITKDGIGALGRFVVGGSLSRYFDEDPRFWRFWADMVATLGYLLEICTAVVPSMFLLFAGVGNFTKVRPACRAPLQRSTHVDVGPVLQPTRQRAHMPRLVQAAGKGIGRPSFRVIQNHFAREANVGDVAAKEEVWEVTAQLTGLAASVAVLESMQAQDQDSAAVVVGAWAFFQGAHIVLRCVPCRLRMGGRALRESTQVRKRTHVAACRFISLGKLQLPWLSQQRLQLLAEDYVAGAPLEGVSELCSRETFAVPKQLLSGAVQTNASVAQLTEAARHVDIASLLHGLPRRQPSSRALYDHLRHAAAVSGDGAPAATGADVGAPHEGEGAGARAHREDASTSAYADPLQAALHLYEWEQYVLLPAPPREGVAQVLDTGARQAGGLWGLFGAGPSFVMGIKDKAAPVDLLQGMLHAAKCRQLLRESGADDERQRSRALVQAFDFAERNCAAFREQLQAAGWDVRTVLMASAQTHELRVEDVPAKAREEVPSA